MLAALWREKRKEKSGILMTPPLCTNVRLPSNTPSRNSSTALTFFRAFDQTLIEARGKRQDKPGAASVDRAYMYYSHRGDTAIAVWNVGMA